jgi:hypothetical protein
MVEIAIEGDKAVFQVQGWDKLWSLRSRLEIPLRHIHGVDADPKPAMGWFQGFKVAGANIPNIFRAGIFYQEGNLVFWDVQNPEKTIVVELADERFAKLIVEVPAPDVAVSVIKNAMAHARG